MNRVNKRIRNSLVIGALTLFIVFPATLFAGQLLEERGQDLEAVLVMVCGTFWISTTTLVLAFRMRSVWWPTTPKNDE